MSRMSKLEQMFKGVNMNGLTVSVSQIKTDGFKWSACLQHEDTHEVIGSSEQFWDTPEQAMLDAINNIPVRGMKKAKEKADEVSG